MSFWPGGRHHYLANAVLTLWGVEFGRVVYVKGTIWTLWNENPRLFFSADHGYLKKLMACEVQRESEVVPSLELKTTKYVNFIALGPSLKDVISREGDPSTVEYVVDSVERIAICKDPMYKDGSGKRNQSVSVHSSIVHAWMIRKYQLPAKDFLSLEFYEQHMKSYAFWSYAKHANQVVSLFENVPKDVLIVAPGDGVGIALRLLGDRVSSTDAVLDSWSLPQVQRKTFSEVLVDKTPLLKSEFKNENNRAVPNLERIAELRELINKEETFRMRLLFLSYVNSLLTVEERVLVEEWPGPVVWLDSVVPVYPNVDQIAPGAWAKNFPEGWLPTAIPVTDSLVVKKEMPYSENLLALESVIGLTDNYAVQYHRMMRPLAYVRKDPVLVLYDMKEWDLFLRSRYKTAYMAIIGKMVLKTSFTIFPVGKLYLPEFSICSLVVSGKSRWDLVKNNFSYCQMVDRLWFCTRDSVNRDDYEVGQRDAKHLAQFVKCDVETLILCSFPRGLLRWKFGGFLSELIRIVCKLNSELDALRLLTETKIFAVGDTLEPTEYSKKGSQLLKRLGDSGYERSWDGDPFNMSVNGRSLRSIVAEEFGKEEYEITMDSDLFISPPSYALFPELGETAMDQHISSMPQEVKYSDLIMYSKSYGQQLDELLYAMKEVYWKVDRDTWRRKL